MQLLIIPCLAHSGGRGEMTPAHEQLHRSEPKFTSIWFDSHPSNTPAIANQPIKPTIQFNCLMRVSWYEAQPSPSTNQPAEPKRICYKTSWFWTRRKKPAVAPEVLFQRFMVLGYGALKFTVRCIQNMCLLIHFDFFGNEILKSLKIHYLPGNFFMHIFFQRAYNLKRIIYAKSLHIDFHQGFSQGSGPSSGIFYYLEFYSYCFHFLGPVVIK